MKKGMKRRLLGMVLAIIMMIGTLVGTRPLEVRAEVTYTWEPIEKTIPALAATFDDPNNIINYDEIKNVVTEQFPEGLYLYAMTDTFYRFLVWKGTEFETSVVNIPLENVSPLGSYGNVYVVKRNSTVQNSSDSDSTPKEKQPAPYVPPTPKELQAIALTESYPNGWEFMKIGDADVFMDFGKDGSMATIWHAGNKLVDFGLKDVSGNPVKMIFVGIKTLEDGTKYMEVMAYSKAGGLNFDNLNEEEIGKLKEAGISGIMIQGVKYNW